MQVCRDVGKTLSELDDEMTSTELWVWAALYEVEAHERKMADNAAKRKQG